MKHATRYKFDILDLNTAFRHMFNRRLEDGIHWDMHAHRRITKIIMDHICDAWNVPVPIGDFFEKLDDKKKAETATRQSTIITPSGSVKLEAFSLYSLNDCKLEEPKSQLMNGSGNIARSGSKEFEASNSLMKNQSVVHSLSTEREAASSQSTNPYKLEVSSSQLMTPSCGSITRSGSKEFEEPSSQSRMQSASVTRFGSSWWNVRNSQSVNRIRIITHSNKLGITNPKLMNQNEGITLSEVTKKETVGLCSINQSGSKEFEASSSPNSMMNQSESLARPGSTQWDASNSQVVSQFKLEAPSSQLMNPSDGSNDCSESIKMKVPSSKSRKQSASVARSGSSRWDVSSSQSVNKSRITPKSNNSKAVSANLINQNTSIILSEVNKRENLGSQSIIKSEAQELEAPSSPMMNQKTNVARSVSTWWDLPSLQSMNPDMLEKASSQLMIPIRAQEFKAPSLPMMNQNTNVAHSVSTWWHAPSYQYMNQDIVEAASSQLVIPTRAQEFEASSSLMMNQNTSVAQSVSTWWDVPSLQYMNPDMVEAASSQLVFPTRAREFEAPSSPMPNQNTSAARSVSTWRDASSSQSMNQNTTRLQIVIPTRAVPSYHMYRGINRNVRRRRRSLYERRKQCFSRRHKM